MVVVNVELLLERRKATTHEQVALAIGVSQPYYSMIEAGRRLPSVEVAMKLGRLLGFNWWELYIAVEDPLPNPGRPDTQE